jgi:hypothetical protein
MDESGWLILAGLRCRAALPGCVVKTARLQKMNSLPDGFAVPHDEWMRRVNHNLVGHAREPGSFNGNLPVVVAGNQQAVDPVD